MDDQVSKCLTSDSNFDVVEKMKQLAEAKENLEEYEKILCEKELEINQMRSKFFSQTEILENDVRIANQRAKDFEDQNIKLRKDFESDQSKFFRFQNESVHFDDSANDQTSDFDFIEKLRQNLEDKIADNQSLESRVNELQTSLKSKNEQLSDLQSTIRKQKKVIESVLHDADSIILSTSSSSLNTSSDLKPNYTNGELVIANMMLLLKTLDNKTNFEVNEIRDKIIKCFREHNLKADDNQINALNETLNKNYSIHREKIKNKNLSLQNKLVDEEENTELKHYLNVLDEDSIASSCVICMTMPTEQHTHSLSVSYAELMKNTTSADFLNRSTEIAQDLGLAINRMTGLRSVCQQLFEKLRGTAEFLEHVLESLEETAEGRELIKNIINLKLDLDKSINEAGCVSEDLHRVKKSLAGFCEFMGQTFDVSEGLGWENSMTVADGDVFGQKLSINLSKTYCPPSENDKTEIIEDLKKQISQLYSFKELYDSVQITLKNELELKNQLVQKNLKLETELNDQNDVVKKLQDCLHMAENSAEELRHSFEITQEDVKKKKMEISNLKSDCSYLCEKLNQSKAELEKTQYELTTSNMQYQEATEKFNCFKLLLNSKENNIVELNTKITNMCQVKKEDENIKEQLLIKNTKLEERCKIFLENAKSIEPFNVQIDKEYEMSFTETEKSDQDFENAEKTKFNIEYNEISKFLLKCQNHANKVIQLLKKADSMVKNPEELSDTLTKETIAKEIPYYEQILNLSRLIRFMLSQKKNEIEKDKSGVNKALGGEICIELKKIYDTLENAKNMTKGLNASQKAAK